MAKAALAREEARVLKEIEDVRVREEKKVERAAQSAERRLQKKEELAREKEREILAQKEAVAHLVRENPDLDGPGEEEDIEQLGKMMISSPPLLDTLEIGETGRFTSEVCEGRYEDDPYFGPIWCDYVDKNVKAGEMPVRHANPDYEIKDEKLMFLLDRNRDVRLLCIPDILENGRRVREIVIDHAHTLLAHLGARKTATLLKEYVWWPRLTTDVKDFVASCTACQTSKPSTQLASGLLHPLDVPTVPWKAIALDFVGPLPEAQTRKGKYDFICVIVDRMTSMVHLAACRTTDGAREVAELLTEEVFKHHGFPDTIVSDRDARFTAAFWKEFHQLIGTKLKMSTAYHPQTDGLTERYNKVLGAMLRAVVMGEQRDWARKLPMFEFAINLARSETTGFSPFYLNNGRLPHIGSWNGDDSPYPGVRMHADRIQTAILAAHDAIIAARNSQRRSANKSRREQTVEVGTYVYLSTKNMTLPKRHSRKLAPKFIGPFYVSHEITKGTAYRLKLSDDLKSRGMHDVFHVSLLKPYIKNDDQRFPNREAQRFYDIKGEEKSELEIKQIIEHLGTGTHARFHTRMSDGTLAWHPLLALKGTPALSAYLELHGVEHVSRLRINHGVEREEEEEDQHSVADQGNESASSPLSKSPPVAPVHHAPGAVAVRSLSVRSNERRKYSASLRGRRQPLAPNLEPLTEINAQKEIQWGQRRSLANHHRDYPVKMEQNEFAPIANANKRADGTIIGSVEDQARLNQQQQDTFLQQQYESYQPLAVQPKKPDVVSESFYWVNAMSSTIQAQEARDTRLADQLAAHQAEIRRLQEATTSRLLAKNAELKAQALRATTAPRRDNPAGHQRGSNVPFSVHNRPAGMSRKTYFELQKPSEIQEKISSDLDDLCDEMGNLGRRPTDLPRPRPFLQPRPTSVMDKHEAGRTTRTELQDSTNMVSAPMDTRFIPRDRSRRPTSRGQSLPSLDRSRPQLLPDLRLLSRSLASCPPQLHTSRAPSAPKPTAGWTWTSKTTDSRPRHSIPVPAPPHPRTSKMNRQDTSTHLSTTRATTVSRSAEPRLM
jgi:transposase InsO family protein/Tfp pilus assembly protein PilV